MKFKKNVLMMVLVLCMSSLSVVFAEETKNDVDKMGSYQPMWSNTISVDTFIEETNSGLNAYAIIVPNDGENVKGVLYLQEYKNGNWSTVKNWKFSGWDYTDVCKSYNTSSGKYRTKVYVNVGGEHITMYSNSKKIN